MSRFITAKEINVAEEFWIQFIQGNYFSNEIKSFRSKGSISKDSAILSLSPILDENGILRVGSRLVQMENDYGGIFPIILPRSNHITKLIVRDAHIRTLHGGVNMVLSHVREKYWIPRARPLIKGIVKHCKLCRRQFGKAANQPFSPLPRNRLVSSRPFETTGIEILAVGRRVLTMDELQTLLTEAESMINNRPLTYMSDDPLDLSPLTPSHFLTKYMINSLVSDLTEVKNEISQDSELRKLWNDRFVSVKFLWKRWKLEYVQLLRSAHLSKAGINEECLKVGQDVLVRDSNKPRVLWKLAII